MYRQIVLQASLVCVVGLLLLSASTSFLSCTGVPKGVESPSSESSGEWASKADASVTDTRTSDTSSQDSGKSDAAGCQPQQEVCNGKDDDCDGNIDNGLSCLKEGETQPCYTGPANTQDKGTCVAGKRTYQGGAWGACVGQVIPTEELCDGLDNNCNGDIDEAVTQACKNDCGPGTQACSGGKWAACDAPKPGTEVCDGKDNDCDGETDEDCSCTAGDTQACGASEGACQKGQQKCGADGKWGTCEGATKPSTEVCNGKDDNCDGAVDEGLTRACYTGPVGTDGVGLCKKGQQKCAAGVWAKCEGEIVPGNEACDGKDNDCSGKTDDLSDLTCGKGPCANKVPACANGSPNTCQPKPAGTEICNGKDDDCDGTPDNGATCPSGQTCTNGTCQGGSPAYRTGSFQSPGSYTVVGKVSFYKTSSGERIELSANFSSSPGPDLYLYLVNVVGGKASNSPKNYISLGKLQKVSGAQVYNLNQSSAGYKSVVVWCQQFSRNFGFANITP